MNKKRKKERRIGRKKGKQENIKRIKESKDQVCFAIPQERNFLPQICHNGKHFFHPQHPVKILSPFFFK